jgi:hypothetical protein
MSSSMIGVNTHYFFASYDEAGNYRYGDWLPLPKRKLPSGTLLRHGWGPPHWAHYVYTTIA